MKIANNNHDYGQHAHVKAATKQKQSAKTHILHLRPVGIRLNQRLDQTQRAAEHARGMQRQEPPSNLLTGTALLTIPPTDPGGRLLRTALGANDGGIPLLVFDELVQLGGGAVVVAFRFGVGVVVVGGGWLEGGGGRGREVGGGVGIGGRGTVLGLSSGVVGGGWVGSIGTAEPGEHVGVGCICYGEWQYSKVISPRVKPIVESDELWD